MAITSPVAQDVDGSGGYGPRNRWNFGGQGRPQADDALSAEAARDFVRTVAPELFTAGADRASSDAAEDPSSLKAHQAQRERAEIQRVLDECGGDRTLASQRLGISRTTLWRKLNPA